MPLDRLAAWVDGVPASLPPAMRPMAESICDSFRTAARRLFELGLGYLSLDRAASTLSTGERQRMQLARAVRNRTTGILYVLDEPSIGLHPDNIQGLTGVMHDLVADGNSVVLVDHDAQILSAADHIIEMGPGAGEAGGQVVAQGSVEEIVKDKNSKIGPFLSGAPRPPLRPQAAKGEVFAKGAIRLSTGAVHTVKPLEAVFPKGRLTAVTGVSGSGKTTLVLESLVPALQARIEGRPLPPHVRAVEAEGIARVKLIDATPIGVNIRSTVATYAGVHDELRKIFARTPAAKAAGYKAGDFSYNTGSLRCPVCDGTGSISLDVQFLPDVDIPCPQCRGARYAQAAQAVRCSVGDKEYSLPELMAMDVSASPGSVRGYEERGGEAAGAARAGPGLSHPRRGDARAFGRRGAAAQAGGREMGRGQADRRVRVRRNPPSACTRWTLPPSYPCSRRSSGRGRRSSSSSTTSTSSAAPTTSSIWARAAARRAGASSPAAVWKRSRPAPKAGRGNIFERAFGSSAGVFA